MNTGIGGGGKRGRKGGGKRGGKSMGESFSFETIDFFF